MSVRCCSFLSYARLCVGCLKREPWFIWSYSRQRADGACLAVLAETSFGAFSTAGIAARRSTYQSHHNHISSSLPYFLPVLQSAEQTMCEWLHLLFLVEPAVACYLLVTLCFMDCITHRYDPGPDLFP